MHVIIIYYTVAYKTQHNILNRYITNMALDNVIPVRPCYWRSPTCFRPSLTLWTALGSCRENRSRGSYSRWIIFWLATRSSSGNSLIGLLVILIYINDISTNVSSLFPEIIILQMIVCLFQKIVLNFRLISAISTVGPWILTDLTRVCMSNTYNCNIPSIPHLGVTYLWQDNVLYLPHR